ncbi:MAG TPA: DUF3786 domain-containing protein [Thermoflexia bacterium]|nr:DUF3786 domain-containing protein [Thermoflexia bacterium]
MLRPGGHPQGLQEWYDKLAPRVAEARERLRQIPPHKLVLRSGCEQEPDGAYRLTFFWRDYRIRPPEFTVQRADTGEEPSSFIQAMLLTYLVTADGTTPSSRWIAFHSLPDGMFYAQAFRGYAENRLVRELGEEGLETFRRGAERLGGEPIEIGDAGYAFQVLPRIHLAAVYWLGDEDFPSRASILFEDTASHYMPTDGLAILGSHLVGAILKAARG